MENLNGLKKAERQFYCDSFEILSEGTVEQKKNQLAESSARLTNRLQVLKKGIFRLQRPYLEFIMEEISHLEFICRILKRDIDHHLASG